MERRGLQVLYGDTDSLFVAADEDDAAAQGERLAEELTEDLARYIAETWRVRSALQMEFETLFVRLFLPPLRSGERGATKRYVGLTGGRLHFTGMEVVRSDWTELAHEVQRELYGRLFAGDPVDDYLRQVIDEVSTGQRDRQLVYRKALRKEAGEYRALPPHVVAARKRGAPAAGELRGVIEYVITVEGPEPASRQDNLLNYEHYIDRQIRPVAEPVLRILNRDFDEIRRNQHQLELFPV
jgi:DNA polymerase-2